MTKKPPITVAIAAAGMAVFQIFCDVSSEGTEILPALLVSSQVSVAAQLVYVPFYEVHLNAVHQALANRIFTPNPPGVGSPKRATPHGNKSVAPATTCALR